MRSERGKGIRAAVAADAPELARLRYLFRSAIDSAEERPDAFVRRCGAWMEERLADPASGWRAWVAESPSGGAAHGGGRIVGHVWVRLLEKIPNPVGEVERHGYLTNMYVIPERRGGGLGTRLLEEALRWCRAQRVGSVVLWPTERSRALYARAGFRDAGDVLELALNPAHCGGIRAP